MRHASNRTLRCLTVLTRVALAVVGGYAASAGLVATLSLALPMAGMIRGEAVVLSSMLGFILYVVLLLWGFTERRLWRFCVALAVCVGSGLASLTAAGG